MAGSKDYEGGAMISSEDESTMVEDGNASSETPEADAERQEHVAGKQGNRDGQVAGTTVVTLVETSQHVAAAPDPSSDSSVVSGNQDEWLAAVNQSDSVNTSLYAITDVDDRLPYRQGWPLLPVLPVLTSRENVPKILSPSSTHFGEFRKVLKKDKITAHDLEVAHRFNTGMPIDKSTLTLCVLSDEKENGKWADAIRELKKYIESHALNLAIEFIDYRIFCGIYTLPILHTEYGLQSAIKKKRRGVARILDESGQPWTSLDFYWRGMGRMRNECKPTVLIGTNVPQRNAWWKEVKESVEKKMGPKWTVEISFGEVVKF